MNKNMLEGQNLSQMLDSFFFAQGASIYTQDASRLNDPSPNGEYQINTFEHGTSGGKGDKIVWDGRARE